jgi:hypothetical protein
VSSASTEYRLTRPSRAVCDVDRAYRELVGHPRAGTVEGANVCSPEPPEPRDYPASPAAGAKYTLCNGHLRDLFDELGRSRAAASSQSTAQSG